MLHHVRLSVFLLFAAPLVSPSLAPSAATAAGLKATIVAVSYGAGHGEIQLGVARKIYGVRL